MVAHAAEQDLAILDRRAARADAALRHAGRGRVHRDGCAVARVAGGTPARTCGSRKVTGSPTGPAVPLHADQRIYAAADVEHLLALHDVLVARLEPMGRLTWATDECEERRLRVRTRPEPEVAWWRMKGARQLRGRSRGVAQQVGAWRERTAAELDVPPRFVLSDLALDRHRAAARRTPARSSPPFAASTVDRCATAQPTSLLAAIRPASRSNRRSVAMPESDHIDRALAPAVTVIGAWLAQRASELDLDPAVLATRADLTQLLHGAPSRIATGWRADLVGAPIQRLAGRGGDDRAARRRSAGRATRSVACASPSGAHAQVQSRRAAPSAGNDRPTTCAPRGGPPTRSRSTASGSGTTSTRCTATPTPRTSSATPARGDGRRDEQRAHRRARHLQLVPQPQPARRHGAHHRPPQRRPVRARHRRRVVRARLHASTATSSAPRPTACVTSPTRLPTIMDRLDALDSAAARAAADPDRRLRPEGHAAAHRRARRRVEHVRSAGQLTPRRTAALDEWCAKLEPRSAPDRAHGRHPGDRDRRLGGLPRRGRRAPHRDDRPALRPRPTSPPPRDRPLVAAPRAAVLTVVGVRGLRCRCDALLVRVGLAVCVAASCIFLVSVVASFDDGRRRDSGRLIAIEIAVRCRSIVVTAPVHAGACSVPLPADVAEACATAARWFASLRNACFEPLSDR